MKEALKFSTEWTSDLALGAAIAILVILFIKYNKPEVKTELFFAVFVLIAMSLLVRFISSKIEVSPAPSQTEIKK